MMIARNWISLTIVLASCGAFAQLPQSLPVPPVLYPNPLRFSYPQTIQIATVSAIGKVTLLPGRERVEVRLRTGLEQNDGWFYVCTAPSEYYVRGLKQGDRVSISPDAKSVRLKIQGKQLRLRIIDVDRWGTL